MARGNMEFVNRLFTSSYSGLSQCICRDGMIYFMSVDISYSISYSISIHYALGPVCKCCCVNECSAVSCSLSVPVAVWLFQYIPRRIGPAQTPVHAGAHPTKLIFTLTLCLSLSLFLSLCISLSVPHTHTHIRIHTKVIPPTVLNPSSSLAVPTSENNTPSVSWQQDTWAGDRGYHLVIS